MFGTPPPSAMWQAKQILVYTTLPLVIEPIDEPPVTTFLFMGYLRKRNTKK